MIILTLLLTLAEGDVAPQFSAKGDDGKTYALKDLKKAVVLYFYPKDDTPGCTAEAKGFQERAAEYAKKDAVVLGVSLDNAESHQAFRKKHGLEFPLLLDGEKIAKDYGVPVTLGYASRHTFVIGKDGKIKKIFRDVNTKTHSDDVLRTL